MSYDECELLRKVSGIQNLIRQRQNIRGPSMATGRDEKIEKENTFSLYLNDRLAIVFHLAAAPLLARLSKISAER